MKGVCAEFELGNPRVYNDLGCSPILLVSFRKWLKSFIGKAEQLFIAIYLFNNNELYNTLLDLADNGCKVVVYSIPLEGYDNDRPISVVNHLHNEFIGKKTKLDFAEPLYKDIIESHHHNFELRIVPHMYLRSNRVKAFSRGNMPYSLHCKNFLLGCKDGSMFSGLSSSNFAVRDAQKIEIASIMSLNENESVSAFDFFEGLRENSIPCKDFDEAGSYSDYAIKMRKTPPNSRLMFIAPFYKDSASQFENNIVTMIEKAKNRIIVCAQHISAYQYSYSKTFTYLNASNGYVRKEGFLNEILKKAESGIQVQLLSQTYVDSNGSHGCRAPENKQSFINFTTAARKTGCQYYVNGHNHSKFIILDDNVIITTCNFTPTQFIYLTNVNITEFDHIPGYSYSGIHCEHGVYSVVSNHDFAERIATHFRNIIKLDNTIRMF
jgi:hypothetical protein